MLFDYCAECRLCCHVETDYPSLEVSLTKDEKKTFGEVCIETECKFLGCDGCRLGDSKPFSCQMYPLAFDPKSRRFFFDSECPLMSTYLEQLKDPVSDASTHLEAIQMKIRALMQSDAAFLKRNFGVDADYFAIEPLPVPPLLVTEK